MTEDGGQKTEDGRQMTEAMEWGMGKAEIKDMVHRAKSRGYGAKGFDFGIRNGGCGLWPIGA